MRGELPMSRDQLEDLLRTIKGAITALERAEISLELAISDIDSGKADAFWHNLSAEERRELVAHYLKIREGKLS